jgi:hypothetical protein
MSRWVASAGPRLAVCPDSPHSLHYDSVVIAVFAPRQGPKVRSRTDCPPSGTAPSTDPAGCAMLGLLGVPKDARWLVRS